MLIRCCSFVRLTHNGDMPPEGCWTAFFRCGGARLGSEEDMNELEQQAKVDQKKNPKK